MSCYGVRYDVACDVMVWYDMLCDLMLCYLMLYHVL